ncbi:MAG: hypothetical protein D6675_02425 [Gemmatimonadetes bacterium]|nr:MAG: hypothetical protein D6675_02425 [Gemmatimonadota bacterium]
MVMINNAAKEVIAKIVYYGPGLSGKTTNLQYIYDHMDETRRGKMVSASTEGDRTLFFDLLPIDLGTIQGYKTKFQLYTVPGQVRYNRIRKIVLQGADAVVFIADSQTEQLKENIDSMKNLRENLSEHGFNLDEMPWVIQYNKRDLKNILSVHRLQEELNPTNVPAIEAIAKEGKGVMSTLKTISKMMIQRFNEKGFENMATAGRRKITKKSDLEKQPPMPTFDTEVMETPTMPPPPVTTEDGEIDVGINPSFFESSSSAESPTVHPEPEPFYAPTPAPPPPEPTHIAEEEPDDSLHLSTSRPNYANKVEVSAALDAATKEIMNIIETYGLTMDDIWYVMSKINNMYIDLRIRRHLERAKMILDSEGGQIFVLRSDDEFE